MTGRDQRGKGMFEAKKCASLVGAMASFRFSSKKSRIASRREMAAY